MISKEDLKFLEEALPHAVIHTPKEHVLKNAKRATEILDKLKKGLEKVGTSGSK